jgi:NADP-dependent 3-hydroxy acid dehydrogenase YdfG
MSEIKELTNIPEEFIKIIKEFIHDILHTFPEYKLLIDKWWKLENNEPTQETIEYIFNYCIQTYPLRFSEILYQNTDLFSDENNYNTEFLPGISFKYLWTFNITDKTRETIWKYLQLILISLIGSIKDKTLFGDTSKLLESMDEEEFKNKLEETLDNMKTLFENNESPSKEFNIPSSDDIHSHMHTMLNGKLGDLAREIAEETVHNFNLDMTDETTDPQELFKKLFSEPDKLMNLVKTVGSKLDSKMKSGEMNQSDLMKEASNMMNQMKSVPGMENIQEMISKMGLGGKNSKINKNAMESEFNKRMKSNTLRERLKKKQEDQKMTKILQEAANEMTANEMTANEMTANEKTSNKTTNPISDDEIVSLFSSKDKSEKKKKKKN